MSKGIIYLTAQDAEAAFYAAFQRADLDAMMQVWDDDESIECIHPLDERLRGRGAVRAGWQRMFVEGPKLEFELSEQSYFADSALAVHTVTEYVRFAGSTEAPTSRVLTTNVYKRTAQGWRMVLHHAAPAPQGGAASRGPLH